MTMTVYKRTKGWCYLVEDNGTKHRVRITHPLRDIMVPGQVLRNVILTPAK